MEKEYKLEKIERLEIENIFLKLDRLSLEKKALDEQMTKVVRDIKKRLNIPMDVTLNLSPDGLKAYTKDEKRGEKSA